MKVALIGYGKMGQAIAKELQQGEHTLVAIIDKSAPEATSKNITKEALHTADVCIDFTRPDSVLENIRKIAEAKKPMVIGTTGWYHHLDEVSKIVKDAEVGLIYGQNLSIGMNLFLQIVKNAAKLVDKLEEYDLSLIEMHHREKVDSPSGTALAITEKILSHVTRKKQAHYGNVEGKIAPDALQISSLRVGSVPGTHTLLLDSSFDTITLTHEARERSGFAKGAIKAAEWILKKRSLHHIEELFSGGPS